MTIQTSHSEIMIMTLCAKLKQVCRKGKYKCEMVYHADAMHYSLRAFTIVGEEKVCIGTFTFSNDSQMTWRNFVDLVHVNDEMKATLMLLYGGID